MLFGSISLFVIIGFTKIRILKRKVNCILLKSTMLMFWVFFFKMKLYSVYLYIFVMTPYLQEILLHNLVQSCTGFQHYL